MVKCQHCGYEWVYGGVLLKPCCPSCRHAVTTLQKKQEEGVGK